jgi:hypothetical protein
MGAEDGGMTHPLLEFLNRCLDEDERVARAALGDTWRAAGLLVEDAVFDGIGTRLTDVAKTVGSREAEHIALHDPAAVLADIAAKRAILAIHADGGRSQGYTETGYGYIDHCCKTCGAFGEYGHPWPCETVRALGSAFTTRPGYLEDRAPT